MHKYTHKVCYYETDRMGITHHSNYIRWMEEARVSYLDEMGCGLAELEKMGIVSPVTKVECAYKATTTFPEEIDIEVNVAEFKGVVLKLVYTMRNASGKIVNEARSEHCFLNEKGNFVRLHREVPQLYKKFVELAEEYQKSLG